MASSVRFSALIKRETMSATSTAAVDVPLPNAEPMDEIATCFVILNTVPHEMLFCKSISPCQRLNWGGGLIVFFQGKIGLQTLLLRNFPNKITILSANIA